MNLMTNEQYEAECRALDLEERKLNLEINKFNFEREKLNLERERNFFKRDLIEDARRNIELIVKLMSSTNNEISTIGKSLASKLGEQATVLNNTVELNK